MVMSICHLHDGGGTLNEVLTSVLQDRTNVPHSFTVDPLSHTSYTRKVSQGLMPLLIDQIMEESITT